MNRLLKAFVSLLFCLAVYHLFVGWLWHVIGYQWNSNHKNVLGLATYVVRGGVFLFIYARTVFHGIKENEANKWWKRAAYWIGLLPLLVSAAVDRDVFLIASGIQHAPGFSDEGVGELVILFQWIMTAFLLRVSFSIFDPDEENALSLWWRL